MILYLTLLFIFLTAIITTVLTKWSKDKCLKFFHRYHVTIERGRGQTIWGTLKVFSNGLEILFDAPYTDSRGHRKTSYLLYQPEVETQVLSILRFHDELSPEQQEKRRRQVRRLFNPGPLRRLWRGVRNFVNTLRDAFNAAIGAVVTQYQRMNPANVVLTSQAGQVTQIGQTLLGRFANAYEPLLEQYIGQPVLVDVQDPINPNNVLRTYSGYLADYTQTFVAVFNVEHELGERFELALPDVESGEALPPLPGPPPPGGPPPNLPAPLLVEHGLAVRLDGVRMKIQNIGHQPVAVLSLQREGYELLSLGCIVPPSATLDLPARDARSATLVCQCVRSLDLVAHRRSATVRHAGDLLPRRGLVEELYHEALPLVPRILKRADDADAQENTSA